MRIICLMGPTASGKTPLAIELIKRFPLEIVSVDSAMVYREMNIGTSKPDVETLKQAPHRLIDVVDPKDAYSAGQFREEALQAIEEIIAAGKTPLLVGGTMLYYRVLQQGLAPLPKADVAVRQELKARAEVESWESLHQTLQAVDPKAAARIHPNDAQRIQRALEVFILTGKPMSQWQAEDTNALSGYEVHNLALMPEDRSLLHERIAKRFEQMLALGFEEEVMKLYARQDLSADLPSIRSVGYREMWRFLAGEITYLEMQEQAISATRQLAKRQLTWLRNWPKIIEFTSEKKDLLDSVSFWIDRLKL